MGKGTSASQSSLKHQLNTLVIVVWHWGAVAAAIWACGGLVVNYDLTFEIALLSTIISSWAVWAANTGLAFQRSGDCHLPQMLFVHRTVKYAAFLITVISLFAAGYCWLILLTDQNSGWETLGEAIGAIILPIVSGVSACAFFAAWFITACISELMEDHVAQVASCHNDAMHRSES